MRSIRCFDVTSSCGASIKTPLFIWPDQYDRLSAYNTSTISKLEDGHKLYFPNHIDYPRVKFRQWASERGISIAKQPKNANATIIDISSIGDILKRAKKVTINKKEISSLDMPMYYENIYTSLSSQTIYYIGEMRGKYAYNGRHYPNITPDISVELYMLDDPLVKEEKALDQFDLLITKYISTKEMDVISWDDFYSQVSSDIKLTSPMFWEIQAMLKSEDDETRELGVEMITNFDANSTPFMFDMLYLLNQQTIKSSMTYNKVTFKPVKTILSSLFTDNSNYHSNYDMTSSYFISYALKSMFTFYRDKGLDVPIDFVRQLYQRIIGSSDAPADVLKQLPGLTVHSIIFDLSPEYFPNQTYSYLKDEQEKPGSGSSMGENLYEVSQEDLSSFSNE